MNPPRLISILFVTLIVIAGLSALAFGVSYLWRSRVERQAKAVAQVINEVERADLVLNLEETTFHEIGASSVAPSDLNLYLEVGDISKFSEWLQKSETLSPLLTMNGGSPYWDSLLDVTEKRFVLIEAGESDLAIIQKVVDREKATSVLDKIKWPEPWGSYFLGDYLIISNSENLAQKCDMAFRKRSLPLSLESSFQKNILTLPPKGLAFIYLPFREKNNPPSTLESDFWHLVPEGLKGEAFVILRKETGKTIVKGE